MSSTPILSIIIPHRGPAEQLQRLLVSIPLREDTEVIVIEDTEAHGAGWARNEGLRKAQGRYVTFADSDDWFLSPFAVVIDSLRHEDADLIFFNAMAVEEETGEPSGRTNRLNWIFSQPDSRREWLLRHTFTEPWCHIVKRSLMEKHGIRFDETPILNDVTFTTLAGYHAQSITVRNIEGYCVCNRRGSTAKRKSDDRLLAYTQVMAKTNAFNRDHGIIYHHRRMMRPLFFSLIKGRIGMARQCASIIRQYGFSRGSLVMQLISYPIHLLLWVINKQKYKRSCR